MGGRNRGKRRAQLARTLGPLKAKWIRRNGTGVFAGRNPLKWMGFRADAEPGIQGYVRSKIIAHLAHPDVQTHVSRPSAVCP